MSEDTTTLILALVTENAELRAQLAEAQDQLVEMAVDTGELHARVEDMQAKLVRTCAKLDVGKVKVFGPSEMVLWPA